MRRAGAGGRGRRGRGGRLAALAVGAAVAVAAGGCGLSLQQLPKIGGMGRQSYPLHARFADVLNLPANAQVRRGSEVIGQVTGIAVHDFVADLTLRVRDGVRLPAGTTAEVRFDNPLGEEYVVLQPPLHPAPAYLAANSVIPTALTQTAPSVEDTLGALSTVLNGGGMAQLGTIIHELNQTFAGNQPQIRQLLSNINTAVTSLAGNAGALDNALAAISSLLQQLNRGSTTIVTGITTLAPAIGVLAGENGQFQQLVNGLDQLSGVADAVVRQSGENSVAAVRSLLPVVDQIVSVESQLGPDLADLQRFEAETPKVAPGNYLQVSVDAQVDINPAPTVATASAASLAALANSAALAAAAGAASTGSGAAGALSGGRAVTVLLDGGQS
jgi:phospholipid/cholesterol/gamma-HCH transport system substrate-binding protein